MVKREISSVTVAGTVFPSGVLDAVIGSLRPIPDLLRPILRKQFYCVSCIKLGKLLVVFHVRPGRD